MKFKPMLALFKNKVIKIYSKLVTKPYVGLYDSTSTVIVYGSVTLADGSRIVVGQFKGYIDSNGVKYACGNIAKFLSNGSIDTNFMTNIGTIGFDANAFCIAIDSSSNVYVGGNFTTFNGNLSNARGIAKLSTAGVFDTAFSNNLDVVSGNKGSGSGFNGSVSSITISGTSLYLGGTFTSTKNIANNARYIAKLTTAGVFDTAFSNNLDVVSGTKATTSGFNSSVQSIAVSATDLYIVGNFTSFKGTASNARYIAKLTTAGVFDTAFSNNLDVVSGTKSSSTSGFNTTALSVVVSGTDLYVAGGFLSFKAAATAYNAPRIAKLTTAGVFDTAFSNNLDVVSGTKAITSGFSSTIQSIALSGSTLYLVGSFTSFKGIANNANRIAKLSTAGVFDTAFSDNLDVVSGTKATTSGFNQPVNSVVVSGTDLYACGSFIYFKNLVPLGIHKMTTSGVTSSYIATYYPGDASEKSIAIDNEGNRYIGGTFTRYNGISSPSIRKILPNGEIDSTFATNMGSGFNGSVTSIVISGANLYVGGAFTTFNGITNNARYIAKLTTAGVFDTAFSNNLDTLTGFPGTSSGFNNVVNSIAVSGTDLYVGGFFTSFKGIANSAKYIAKLSTAGVFDTAFSDNLDVVSGTKATTSGFDTAVESIAVSGTSLYVGGSFTTFKGTTSNARYIAKLSTAGVFDTAFSDNLDVVSGTKSSTSGFNGGVYSVAVSGASLYVGGVFNAFNEIFYNANYIAKLSTAGVFDTAFSDNLDVVSGTKATTSGFSSQLTSIVLSGTDLYVGGTFTTFKNNSFNANYIAKLTTAGVFDTAFSNNLDVVSGTKSSSTSGFDNFVYELAYDYNSNTLVMVGSFYRFKGSMAIGTYTL